MKSNFKAATYYLAMFTAAVTLVVIGRNKFDQTPFWLHMLCIIAFLVGIGLLIDVAKDRRKAKHGGASIPDAVTGENIDEAGVLRAHHSAIWKAHLEKHFPNHQVLTAGDGVLVAMNHGEPIGAADTVAKNFWAVSPFISKE